MESVLKLYPTAAQVRLIYPPTFYSYSLTHSFIHSFIHSSIHPLTYSSTHSHYSILSNLFLHQGFQFPRSLILSPLSLIQELFNLLLSSTPTPPPPPPSGHTKDISLWLENILIHRSQVPIQQEGVSSVQYVCVQCAVYDYVLSMECSHFACFVFQFD